LRFKASRSWVYHQAEAGLFIEAVPMLVVRPGIDQLFVLNVGARVHF
jgi:hypothetical protein